MDFGRGKGLERRIINISLAFSTSIPAIRAGPANVTNQSVITVTCAPGLNLITCSCFSADDACWSAFAH
jgi:hypothetical protein